MMPPFTMTAGERMNLTAVIGKDGVRSLDNILSKLRTGAKPNKADIIALARALHENDVVDFGDWPEFRQRRKCEGAGHPFGHLKKSSLRIPE